MPKQILRSFSFAIRGLSRAWRTERSIRLQLALLLIAIIAGLVLRIAARDWIAIVIVSAVVVSVELVNTALEYVLDAIKPRLDVQVKVVKDIAAGAVFVASVGAAIVGFLVFYPYFRIG